MICSKCGKETTCTSNGQCFACFPCSDGSMSDVQEDNSVATIVKTLEQKINYTEEMNQHYTQKALAYMYEKSAYKDILQYIEEHIIGEEK